MSIESPADLHGMREVGRVVAMALDAMAAEVRPGITTGALDAVADAIVRENGARSAPADVYGFPRTVLISVNDEVVHGIPGERRIARGDLVKLDVTLEKDGYVADAARTVVAGGGNALGARLASCAEAAFHAALAVASPGAKVNTIGSEPIITAGGEAVVTGDDGWTITTRDGSLAAHFEHTLMITAAGPVILTANAA